MQVALTCLAGLLAAVPTELSIGGGTCGAERQPWVRVRFEGGPWSARFAGAVLEELQATLLQQGIDACLEGPRVPAPLALVKLTQTSTAVRVTVDGALGTGAKITERNVEVNVLPKDGRALAIAVAADELLRARWKEMEIWPGGQGREPAEARDSNGGPLWPKERTSEARLDTRSGAIGKTEPRAPPSEASAIEPDRDASARSEVEIETPPGPPPATEIGARFAFERFAGGQTHFGPDLALRRALADRLSIEIAAGFRSALAVDTKDGRITARAIAVSAALAYDLYASSSWSIDLEGSLRAAWVTFSGAAQPGIAASNASSIALYARGGGSVRRAIAGAFEVRLSGGIGIPLHAFAANDQGSTTTGVSSLEAYGSIGVGAGF